MQIHQRTTYTYDGKDYRNLDALENGILESIVRSTPLPLHPKERRDMMDVLIAQREGE